MDTAVKTGLYGSCNLLEVKAADIRSLSALEAASVRAVACIGSFDAADIDRLPNLELIASFGVGYDGIDVRHAAARGIVVTNTPDVLTDEVADATIGLLINVVRRLSKAEAWLRAGHWARGQAYPLSPLTLRSRTVGIFGLGRIGRAIARRTEAFGLPIAYHNRRPVEDVPYRYCPSLIELASTVDTLIAAAPGGPSSDRAIGKDVFEALGPKGVFINVGRGSAVDEAALISALADGTIAAAGLDVFANEPAVSPDLLALENVTVLPHIAAATVETRAAVAKLVVDNVVQWFTLGQALTPVVEIEA
ncbi:2-hydroxyacid dehydrogenase [Phyllobacterium phragmitis]|uniref:2-hydroxyacid dehydrogenase n=1 Tax=Phyllobacterium phragmitis TaxID=2670329 RepID=A0A2S9ILA2_9HYPH|nr:2-hydroxyacid dehydrogenase [Phyllobacterium phragmitis]